jgi:hypothetical protein
VLRINDIADSLWLLGEQRRGDESKDEKVFHGWGIVEAWR